MTMFLIYGMFLIIMVAFGILVYANLKPPKYNGFLWLHPDHIKASSKSETMVPIYRIPEGQKPFHYGFDWYRWKQWPLYFWYEKEPVIEEKVINGNKAKVRKYPIAHWEPDKPPDFNLRKDDPQSPKEANTHSTSKTPFVTPNELWDNTDWECAKRFETVKSKIAEAVKLGAAVIMVAVCLVALIMLVDMISKKPATAYTPADIQYLFTLIQAGGLI